MDAARRMPALALALAFAFAVAARVHVAHAWVCPPGSFDPDVVFPRSELVFTAQVVAATRVAGRDLALTRLRVEHVLRGAGLAVGAVVELRRCVGSKCGGGFRRGERWVVFGRHDGRGRITDNGACGLSRRLGEPTGDGVLRRAEALAGGVTPGPPRRE